MKDLIKTGVLVALVLFIIFIVFLIGELFINDKDYIGHRNKLIETDPTVSILYDRIKNKNNLRKANFKSENIESLELTKYVLDHLISEDRNVKKYNATKGICFVDEMISFATETNNCEVLILDNNKILEYQNKYFGISKDLKFQNFQYNEYTCKNNEDKYYCLIENYNDYVYGYSTFIDAYEEKDKIVIFEYYLQVNVSDKDRCMDFFESDYCQNYEKMEKPYLSSDVIKENGVLYKHIFKSTQSNYYLAESLIVQ